MFDVKTWLRAANEVFPIHIDGVRHMLTINDQGGLEMTLILHNSFFTADIEPHLDKNPVELFKEMKELLGEDADVPMAPSSGWEQ